MKHRIRTLFFWIAVAITFPHLQQAAEIQPLTHGWFFQKGALSESDFDPELTTEQWESVSVPHDWAIAGPFDTTPDIHGGTGRLPWQGVARYRRILTFPDMPEGQRSYLDFDGVMAAPQVYLNGERVGSWDYGYTPFRVDLTEHIRAGEPNVLVVLVDTREWYSRWYPGAGIYRKVNLVTCAPVHLANHGVFARLSDPEKPHSLHIEAQVENHLPSPSDAMLRFSLLDGEKVVQEATTHLMVAASASATTSIEMSISEPVLWDIKNPHLYTLKTELITQEGLSDSDSTAVGLRTIRFTANDGFFLNGRRVQFHGVNLHHDLGPLGAAFNLSAARRQLEIMQSMGVNALRTSHNPPAQEVLDLCDQMGILVWDEAFDKWDKTAGRKGVDDPPLDTFGKRQLEAMMLRDRNHPSVIVWSIGNELSGGEMGITPENVSLMTAFAKEIDDSRPIGMGCHIPSLAYGGNFDALDLTGWNYARRYMDFRGQYPDKPILYSESASALSTRGYYAFPQPARHTDTLESFQVSSYDMTSAAWSDIPDAEFKLMEQDTWVHGEFVWTGIDYIGEPTPYDLQARSSYFGIVDLCGFEKDRFYLYKSHWNPEVTTLHILPHWNWPDRIGQNVPVFVYTNGDSAELFINGKSQGMRRKGEIPKRPANLAPGATLLCSDTADESVRDAIKDGDTSTVWRAANSGRGAWVSMDFGKQETIRYLGLHFGEAEKYFGYTVWGSEDGENWRFVVEKPTSMVPQWSGSERMYHAVDGSYRYLKIKFDQVRQDDRDRAVSIREISVYPEVCESDYYDVTYQYRLRWNDVVYEPGEVKVIAYKNGKILGEKTLQTVEAPVAIRLTSDRASIDVKNDELAFITVEVVDAQGRPSPIAQNEIQFSISSDGLLAGTGNGNPLSFESFQSHSQSLWAGKALLIVRGTPEGTGPIEIRASSEGLESATLTLEAAF